MTDTDKPDLFAEWVNKPEIQTKLNEARATYGTNISGILSGWGPFVIIRKPTFEEELAFHASQKNPNPTQQCWGGIKLVEACLLYPSHQDFMLLRQKHGFLFADNIASFCLSEFGPEKNTESKKL